jgi:hypothetical protein
MQHAAVVRGRESGADLAGELDGFILRQPGKRSRDDRAKDILYMHDTLQIFGAKASQILLGKLH